MCYTIIAILKRVIKMNDNFGVSEFIIGVFVILVCLFLVIMYINRVSKENNLFSYNIVENNYNI